MVFPTKYRSLFFSVEQKKKKKKLVEFFFFFMRMSKW